MRRTGALALGLILLLTLAATRGSDRPVTAQGSPDLYLQSVVLTGTEVPGYRHRGSFVAPEFAQINALASYGSHFTAETLTGTRAPGFVVWAAMFPTNTDAAGAVSRLRRSTRDTIAGYTLLRTPDVGTPITGADEAVEYVWIGTLPDGRTNSGLGVAWRFGNVFFELFTYSQSEQGRVTGLTLNDEMYLLAQRQSRKYNNTPKYTPAAPPTGTAPTPPPAPAPTPTPQSQPSAQAQPNMLLLVTALTGGAIARDGTTIRAFVGGRECGSETILFGWAFLTVYSRDSRPGCGADGATISFSIGELPAAETIPWSLDSFVRGVQLTAQGGEVASGLLARPVASISCRPPAGASQCSDLDRRLWDGSLRGWLAVLESRGEEASGEALLLAWAQFRAQRDEVLGNLVLALLERRSFSFISAVRFAPADNAPYPYIEIATRGVTRAVGGWRVITIDGGEYVFPAEATLGNGTCRIYLSAEGAAQDSESDCPGAMLTGTSLARPAVVYILDERGEIVDSVGF